LSKRRYRSAKAAERARTEACAFAASIIAAEGGLDDKGRLWALCVFFETYIAGGSKATVKDFAPKKPKRAPIIQLIQRDD
jgi:hypothetical protein